MRIRWLSNLQFRFLAGFLLALVLALGGLIVFLNIAAKWESAKFQEEVEEARAERTIEENQREEEAFSLSRPRSWNIQIRDENGELLAYSGIQEDVPEWDEDTEAWLIPIYNENQPYGEIGRLMIRPAKPGTTTVEPPPSRLVSAFQRTLIWAGVGIGMLGFGLIFLVTRKIIVPVRQLNTAVNRMQEGDLSYRVPVGGSGEISELASSFNSMTAKLEAAEIQRQKLLADVAHELRTPLTNARGYVEAMRDGVMPTDSQVVASVYRQMVHLTNLVDDLRILTLAESGHLEFRMELDSVTDILNASVREFEPVAMAKGISLKLNCPSYLPLVTLDRTRINQVLNNLIQNAIFHTPENGSVILSAKISGEQISVMVADSGPGIEQDNLPHLFDRFYRSDQSRNRSSGGSGLGLAIARHLVEAHGGTIEAKSQKNEGSVFTFTLPINPVKSDQSPTEVSLIKVSN